MSTSWKAGTVCDLALCLQHLSPCRRAGIRPVKSGGRQKRDRRLLGLPSLPTSLSASPHIEPHSSWSPSFPRSPVYTPPPIKLGLRKTSAPSRTPFRLGTGFPMLSQPQESCFSHDVTCLASLTGSFLGRGKGLRPQVEKCHGQPYACEEC